MNSATAASTDLTVAKGDSYIIVLPVEGAPYIHSVYKAAGDNLTILQDCVGGCIEAFNPDFLTVHPIFKRNKRWDVARILLGYKKTKVYVNEEGKYKCSANMALINLYSGIPVHGDVAIVVPPVALTAIGIKPSDLAEEPYEEPLSEEDDE
jgi:hypothetical protein